ncbi:lipid A-modifier LpxR family protein [Roseateles sp. LKC17W]|uniref:Lipid A-modifier LpxR family protein n=2 Tax=Pelomonas margarita TaxID=3299031 RepID=A0ABW7FJB3_9BURK
MRPMLSPLFVVMSMCATCWAAPGSAPEVESAPGKSGYRGWQFDWDNDMFARTDRWFTNAMRVSWVVERPHREADPISARLLDARSLLLGQALLAAPAQGEKSGQGIAYNVGQLMYTPADITISAPQHLDRPWSGALYAGATVFGYRSQMFESTDLKLGVAGRGSKAAWVQRKWHRLIGADYPAGWEHQQPSRPFVQAQHMALRSFGDRGGASDRWGFHTGYAAAVGTHRSYASLLAGLSLGWQAGRNPVFAVSNDGDLVVHDLGETQALRRLLVFANVSATAVGHNRFITGRTVSGDPELRLRRGVAALQLGANLPLGRHWRVMYTHTLRSAEFVSNRGPAREASQRWGTVSLVHTE